MTSQVRNLWCRSQNKMGPSSKYVSSQHIVDLRQPQVAMKHYLRSVKNTCVAQSLYSEFRPLNSIITIKVLLMVVAIGRAALHRRTASALINVQSRSAHKRGGHACLCAERPSICGASADYRGSPRTNHSLFQVETD